MNFVDRIIRRLNDEPEFLFTATKDQDEDSTPRFKVTLGVIPDYLYAGQGMRIGRRCQMGVLLQIPA